MKKNVMLTHADKQGHTSQPSHSNFEAEHHKHIKDFERV